MTHTITTYSLTVGTSYRLLDSPQVERQIRSEVEVVVVSWSYRGDDLRGVVVQVLEHGHKLILVNNTHPQIDLAASEQAEAEVVQLDEYRAASEQEEPVIIETCDELLEMLPATTESYTSVLVKGSTGKLYTVTMFEPSRANGCTCKGWTYRRSCRHLRIAEKLPATLEALDELINGRGIAVSEVVRSWRGYEGRGDSVESIMDRIIAFVGESRMEGVKAL